MTGSFADPARLGIVNLPPIAPPVVEVWFSFPDSPEYPAVQARKVVSFDEQSPRDL